VGEKEQNMWVRMSIFQGAPNQTDEEVEQINKVIREDVLPSARGIEGYKGAISMGDRNSGKGISLTFWKTEEAMRASEDVANELRQRAAAEADEEIAGVERYEVYIYEPPNE
jgi:heme-degrading monooxygenase HmoA